MSQAHFQPRQNPQLLALLRRILDRVAADLPDVLGLAIVVHDKRFDDRPSMICAHGVASELVDAQLCGLDGPVIDALSHQVPVLSLELWTDDRWPRLTLEAVRAQAPGHDTILEHVRGVAAVPGEWENDATVVVSCALSAPATAATIASLLTCEQLVSAALITTAAQNAAAIEDMLTVLQSRGAIEQAKGALMGLIGCDAEYAWSMLRRASQEFNIKLRVLAVALLEHISDAPAEQPATDSPITTDQQAREAARLMWTALAESSRRSAAR